MSTTIAVIPAYNEGEHIKKVIAKVKPFVDNLVVVDDGSQDDTFELARQVGFGLVLRHEINLGKGAALRTGCEAAIRLGATHIVMIDADDQHDPSDIPKFVAQLEGKGVDVVFGSREFNKEMPGVLSFGNKLLSRMIRWFFKVNIRDTQSGYRAFNSSVFDALRWDSTGYEAETEMIVNVGEHELSYSEIAIETIYHDRYKGTTALDGVKIILQIFKWKFL